MNDREADKLAFVPKEPWQECPEVWKTQAAYFNWIRGQMRRAWSRHPVKNKFIRLMRFKAPLGKSGPKNPDGQMIWCAKCACCDETFKQTKLQVDHIDAAGSFKGWNDFSEWMMGLMHINVAGLQFLCKMCHDTKSYADKHGMTFERAALEKEVIAFTKWSIAKQDRLLAEFTVTHCTNAKQRRAAYTALLLEKYNENGKE